MAAAAGWDFGTLAVLARSDSPVSTNASSACLYAGSDADGDGWGWKSGRSCLVTNQNRPVTEGRETNGFTFPYVSVYPPCILKNSDPDEDGWGWEDGMSCISGAATIKTAQISTQFHAVGNQA